MCSAAPDLVLAYIGQQRGRPTGRDKASLSKDCRGDTGIRPHVGQGWLKGIRPNEYDVAGLVLEETDMT